MMDKGFLRKSKVSGRGNQRIFVFAFFALFFMLAFPRDALAFGPATHIDLGLHVLRYAALLPPLMRRLLQSHPDVFLYGNFAADQVVAKNMAQEIHHCHNWNVGFRILDVAPTDEIKALCWGFLSHLAADMVAHNVYVPVKMVTSYGDRTTRHVYWELRYDRAMHDRDGVWDTMKRLGGKRFREADVFLREELSRASRFLPYDVSRVIFNSIMLLNQAEIWREKVSNVADRSSWRLREEDLMVYNKMALDSVFALLIDGKGAAPVNVDPTGMNVLTEAKTLRKKLKRKMRRGFLAKRLSPGTEAKINNRVVKIFSAASKPVEGPVLPGIDDILAWERLERLEHGRSSG